MYSRDHEPQHDTCNLHLLTHLVRRRKSRLGNRGDAATERRDGFCFLPRQQPRCQFSAIALMFQVGNIISLELNYSKSMYLYFFAVLFFFFLKMFCNRPVVTAGLFWPPIVSYLIHASQHLHAQNTWCCCIFFFSFFFNSRAAIPK